MSAIVHTRDSSVFQQQQDNVWIIWLWWALCPALPSASSPLFMRRAAELSKPQSQLRSDPSGSPPKTPANSRTFTMEIVPVLLSELKNDRKKKGWFVKEKVISAERIMLPKQEDSRFQWCYMWEVPPQMTALWETDWLIKGQSVREQAGRVNISL